MSFKFEYVSFKENLRTTKLPIKVKLPKGILLEYVMSLRYINAHLRHVSEK